jgi:hypothetical protein
MKVSLRGPDIPDAVIRAQANGSITFPCGTEVLMTAGGDGRSDRTAKEHPGDPRGEYPSPLLFSRSCCSGLGFIRMSKQAGIARGGHNAFGPRRF